MNGGRWKPGESGNPAGKKPGTKNRKTLLREEIEKEGPALVAAIKAAALNPDNPDTTAMSLWLSRLEPPLRPAPRCVQFELDTDKPIAEQSIQVVQAMARGELDPDTAKQILDMLSAYVGLVNVENFLEELKRFAESKKNRAPGSVLLIQEAPPEAAQPTIFDDAAEKAPCTIT